MRRASLAILILGFLFVDFLFFHDILKPDEVTTLPQYLTGGLSIPVILYATHELSKRRAHHQSRI
jgi:hypothetical protein